MIFLVPNLMQLAALDDRAVEHVDRSPAQGLGPIKAHQHRAGHVQTPLTQADQQVGDQGRVLGRALHQRQRVLVALDVDAQGDDTAGFGEVHPVDHRRDEIQPGQILRQQLGQRGFGQCHEAAGDRGFACRRG